MKARTENSKLRPVRVWQPRSCVKLPDVSLNWFQQTISVEKNYLQKPLFTKTFRKPEDVLYKEIMERGTKLNDIP